MILDGKKTTIAAGLLTVGAFIDQVVLGIWQATIPYLPQVGSTLDWAGMALGGVGLTHKGVKLLASRKGLDKAGTP